MNKIALAAIAALIIFAGVYAFQSSPEDTGMAAMEKEMTMTDDKADSMEEEEVEGVMVGGALMVQNLDIVENAKNASNVTTVVAAVAAAGLVDTLKSEGPFTVFAPTNAAFDALPAGTVETLLMPENKDDLVNILTYHVVAGSFTSADLKDGMKLETVQGQEIVIGNKNGQISINGTAMVETADVISSNGVTFVIDSVLIPPTE